MYLKPQKVNPARAQYGKIVVHVDYAGDKIARFFMSVLA